jgi:hypothetical protein
VVLLWLVLLGLLVVLYLVSLFLSSLSGKDFPQHCEEHEHAIAQRTGDREANNENPTKEERDEQIDDCLNDAITTTC